MDLSPVCRLVFIAAVLCGSASGITFNRITTTSPVSASFGSVTYMGVFGSAETVTAIDVQATTAISFGNPQFQPYATPALPGCEPISFRCGDSEVVGEAFMPRGGDLSAYSDGSTYYYGGGSNGYQFFTGGNFYGATIFQPGLYFVELFIDSRADDVNGTPVTNTYSLNGTVLYGDVSIVTDLPPSVLAPEPETATILLTVSPLGIWLRRKRSRQSRDVA